MSTDYDEETWVVLKTTQDLERGAIDHERAELQLRQMSELRQTLEVGGELLRAGVELARHGENIFLAAFDTYRACAELDAITRQFEARAAVQINHVGKSAPVTEKMIDRLMDRVDRLLDRVMDIDVDTCSDAQLANREMMVDQLTRASDQAHDALMKFLTI